MSGAFFPEVDGPIGYAGPDSTDPLTFRWYDAEREVAGRRMADHLRFAVAYWHSFNWTGFDIFGDGALPRPWLHDAGDPMDAARRKMEVAFEFLAKLGVPFFCFHDRDIAPAGDTFAASCANLDAMADEALRRFVVEMELVHASARIVDESRRPRHARRRVRTRSRRRYPQSRRNASSIGGRPPWAPWKAPARRASAVTANVRTG